MNLQPVQHAVRVLRPTIRHSMDTSNACPITVDSLHRGSFDFDDLNTIFEPDNQITFPTAICQITQLPLPCLLRITPHNSQLRSVSPITTKLLATLTEWAVGAFVRRPKTTGRASPSFTRFPTN